MEFYVSNTEIRQASKQLILLDGQELSEVQRFVCLGTRSTGSSRRWTSKRCIVCQARTVAGNVYKWGLATDLGLLAAEAMLDAGALKKAPE